MTLDQLLRQASLTGGLSRLETRILLATATGKSPEWLIAHGLDEADDPCLARFQALIDRRVSGEPIAYLTGTREFYGRPFKVSPAVLIPRPDTEVLVEFALARIAHTASPRILDLGTGSGILAVTLALERPDAAVTATDISLPALAAAKANAAALGATVSFLAGDWWQAIDHADRRFDLVVCNPPYIAAADPHLLSGDLRFEPRSALSAGPRGDDAIRQVLDPGPSWLSETGWLALEHGFEQAAFVRDLMKQRGFQQVGTEVDLELRERVTAGRAAPP